MRNTRYPEGSIAERYLSQESVTYCKSYMLQEEHQVSNPMEEWNISSVCQYVQPFIMDTSGDNRLTESEAAEAHWQVLTETDEANSYMDIHLNQFIAKHGDVYEERRMRRSFLQWFSRYVNMQSQAEDRSLIRGIWSLAQQPQLWKMYKACSVNGVKFVAYDKDEHLTTQNSGVMMDIGTCKFYGHLDYVVEILYAGHMPVVLFKCTWHNTTDTLDDEETDTVKIDHGLISVDINTSYYEDSPFIIATKAKQVFYLDDPKAGGSWKVVQEMTHRNVYSVEANAIDHNVEITDPYQENTPTVVQFSQLDANDLQLHLDIHGDDEEDDEEVEDDEEDDDEDEEEEEDDDDEEEEY